MLRVIILVNDYKLYFEQFKSFENWDHREFSIHPYKDAISIASGYNSAVKSLQHSSLEDVLCFIHQDARLLFDAPKIIPLYMDHLDKPGILGFCGSSNHVPGNQWWQCKPCYGSLIQGQGNEAKPLYFSDCPQALSDMPDLHFAEVQTIDGFCLFVRRNVFNAIDGFNEAYGGWHCYDIDICMRAIKTGYKNYVINQPSQHFSWGSSGPDLDRSLRFFAENWRKP